MTERDNHQVPNNPSIPPLTLEELRLALQEYDEDGQNQQAAKERRRAGLLQVIGNAPTPHDVQSSAPMPFRPAPNPETTPNEDVAIEAVPKVIDRHLTVDGKPVYITARVSDDLRREYIQDKQDEGRAVEYDLVNPEDDVTSFRGGDQEKLAQLLASDGKDQEQGAAAVLPLRQKLGTENVAAEFPLEKRRSGVFRNKKIVRVGAVALVAAAVTTTIALLPKGERSGDASAATVSAPENAIEEAKKKIDMQALISDCTPEKIGAPVASGIMSVDAGVIWKIPGGTEQFPKLNLGEWDHDNDPATAPASEPRFLPVTANDVTLAMAVCDTAEKTAVTMQGETLHVDLASVSPQVAFDASEKNAPQLSALSQEDLNKFVARKWMSQESADALRKNMIDPKLAIAAAKETLHGVVEQMKQKDNETGQAVVAALKGQLQAAISKQLPVKPDGKPFEVVLDGELTNDRIQGVGVSGGAGEAFILDAPRIITQKINTSASEAKQ